MVLMVSWMLNDDYPCGRTGIDSPFCQLEPFEKNLPGTLISLSNTIDTTLIQQQLQQGSLCLPQYGEKVGLLVQQLAKSDL